VRREFKTESLLAPAKGEKSWFVDRENLAGERGIDDLGREGERDHRAHCPVPSGDDNLAGKP
jgi:hypothetical protein